MARLVPGTRRHHRNSDGSAIACDMLFVIAVADGVFPSGFTLIHDTLIVAEHLRLRHDRAIPEITVVVAGDEPLVRTASGVLVPTTIQPQSAAGADVVIVP